MSMIPAQRMAQTYELKGVCPQSPYEIFTNPPSCRHMSSVRLMRLAI